MPHPSRSTRNEPATWPSGNLVGLLTGMLTAAGLLVGWLVEASPTNRLSIAGGAVDSLAE